MGSVGYTDFEIDGEDQIDMYTEKPELMNQKTGLVHSHHNMDTFFSGTDTDELHEKAMNGLYLSLIVNNSWEPIAKLAWGGTVKRKISSVWNWTTINQESKNEEVEEMEVVYELDLDVIIEGEAGNTLERMINLEKEEKKEKKSFGGDRLAGMMGAVWEPGTQGKMFEEPVLDALAEEEPSLLDWIHSENKWEDLAGKIFMGDQNFKGNLDAALTDFAQGVMKKHGDADMELFAEAISDAVHFNLKKARPMMLDIIGTLFIPVEDWKEVLAEIDDEIDVYEGRVVSAIQEGIREHNMWLDTIVSKKDIVKI